MEIPLVKIRHTVLALLAIMAIAFMQPLVFFVGGLTLLIGVGALIFRDLSPAGQEAVERRLLGWLRQARSRPTLKNIESPTANGPPSAMTTVKPVTQKPERIRRVRARTAAIIQNDPGPHRAPEASARDEAASNVTNRYEKTSPAPSNDTI
jgi:hypothetical protein